jgi:hypothetical protein
LKIDNNINRINKFDNKSYAAYSEQNIKNHINAFDNFDVSNFDLEIIDYKKLTKSTLEDLSKNYKNINIYILEKGKAMDIKSLANNLGNGKHLIISKDFIDKMGSGEEAYNRGKAIVEQILKDMSSFDFGLKNGIKSYGSVIDDKSINFWIGYEKRDIDKQKDASIKLAQNNFLDPIKNLEKQGDEFKKKLKSINKTVNIKTPMDVYSRLASAKSKPEVMSVVSMARSNITKLKRSIKDSDNNQKIKIKAMINQLEKAITRSYRKIKDLASEDNLAKGRKSAEIREKKKLAMHNSEELNRRRVIRRIREKAQIDEANPLYYYPQMFLNKKDEGEEDKSYIQTIDISGIAPTIDVANVSITAPVQQSIEITVMPSIDISL